MSEDTLTSREAGPAALRGGALRSAGYVAGVLLTLLSAPVLIRYLGNAEFGRYTTVVALLAIVGGLTEAGISTIAQRELATRTGAERTAVMRQLIGLRIVVTVVGVAGAVLFGVAAGYDDVLLLGTVAAGFGLLLSSLQSLLTAVLQAQLRFGWATTVELARQVVTVVLIVGLVVAGASLLPFLAVPIAAGVVGLSAIAWLVRDQAPLRPAWAVREWGGLVRATLPFAVATALNATYFRVAVIVMSIVATEAQTGYYATAFRVVEVLLLIPVIGVGAAFPILARAAGEDPSRFGDATVRILELALLAGVWFALCLVLGAQVAVDVLSDDAQPAVAVLRLQALALIATFLAVAAAYPLLSLHRGKAIMLANGLALLVAVGLTLALVPGLEARGAAIATTLAELTSAAVLLAVLVRARPELRRAARAVPAVVAAGAAGAAVALVPGLPALLDVVLGNLAFFAVLVAAGGFPPEARELLRRPAAARAVAP